MSMRNGFVFLFVFFTTYVNAQLDTLKLSGMVKAYPSRVSMRWNVKNPGHFPALLNTVWKLEVKQLVSEDEDPKLVYTGNFGAWNSEEWAKYTNTSNKQMLVAYSLHDEALRIYESLKDVNTSNKDSLNEILTGAWSFSSVAADLDSLTAVALGMRFDFSNRSLETDYIIRIFAERSPFGFISDTLTAFVGKRFTEPRRNAPALYTHPNDRAIELLWLHDSNYTAYFIEKRELKSLAMVHLKK